MFLSVFGKGKRFEASGNNDRSPWGSFWFSPIGQRSLAGMRVSSDTAMQISAVFACVAVLAESFAILPPVLYRQDGRKRVRVTDHWLNRLLKRPNRYQNGFEWREMLQGHLALRGNAYNQILSNGRGEIVELLPLNPDRVKVMVNADGSYYYLYNAPDGSQQTLTRGEVWHLKGLAPDYYRGYNPIELNRDGLGIALAAQAYGAKFFGNDAKPSGGWIEFAGKFSSDEAKQIFKDSWQEAHGGNNRGKIAVLESGMKYHEIGVSNADAQFLETRRFSIEDIARLFRVPPHRIGHLDKATNNNIEHQGLEFVTYSLSSWVERWKWAIESDLLLDDEDVEVDFDYARLLKGDSKSRSLYYHNGILDGWMVRNEARQMEGLDPLDGLDEPLRPLNMVPEAEADEEMDEEEDDEKTDKNKEGR